MRKNVLSIIAMEEEIKKGNGKYKCKKKLLKQSLKKQLDFNSNYFLAKEIFQSCSLVL